MQRTIAEAEDALRPAGVAAVERLKADEGIAGKPQALARVDNLALSVWQQRLDGVLLHRQARVTGKLADGKFGAQRGE